jgi:hypothetical protein
MISSAPFSPQIDAPLADDDDPAVLGTYFWIVGSWLLRAHSARRAVTQFDVAATKLPERCHLTTQATAYKRKGLGFEI